MILIWLLIITISKLFYSFIYLIAVIIYLCLLKYLLGRENIKQ